MFELPKNIPSQLCGVIECNGKKKYNFPMRIARVQVAIHSIDLI